MSIKIIHSDCDPIVAKNRELPLNSYLVTYVSEGEVKYDVTQSDGVVPIFDYYYDLYKEVKGIKWTDGKINPKMWDYKPRGESRKRR